MKGKALSVKGLVIGILFLFIGTSVISETENVVIERSTTSSNNLVGNTLYVGGTGPNNYTKIQDAINDASDDNTVFVYSGTYYEHLVVDKTVNLIGENKYNTIVDSGGENDTVRIGTSANGVTISGFTIQNSGDQGYGGHIDAGIDILSHNNVIFNNILINHPLTGIYLYVSNQNNITHNIIKHTRSGIDFNSASENIISHNNFSYNSEWGVVVHVDGKSANNIISHNTFFENTMGLALYHSNNRIYKNNFIKNSNFNAASHFNPFRMTPSRNSWDENFWDDWRGFGPKHIPGFFGFNFDLHPAEEPYTFEV